MGIETVAVAGIIWVIEYAIGKSKRIKANSVPEATIEAFAKGLFGLAMKLFKK